MESQLLPPDTERDSLYDACADKIAGSFSSAYLVPDRHLWHYKDKLYRVQLQHGKNGVEVLMYDKYDKTWAHCELKKGPNDLTRFVFDTMAMYGDLK